MSVIDRLIALTRPATFAVAGKQAIYSDGQVQYAVCVKPGATKFWREDAEHQTTVQRAADWLIAKSELPIEPQPGHRLTILETGSTFEVVPYNGEPAARDRDTTGQEWRVHCQKLS